MEDMLTTQQAAQILGISPRRVNFLARQGRLGRRFEGFRTWFFTREEVEAFAGMERKPGNPKAGTYPRQPDGKWVKITEPSSR